MLEIYKLYLALALIRLIKKYADADYFYKEPT